MYYSYYVHFEGLEGENLGTLNVDNALFFYAFKVTVYTKLLKVTEYTSTVQVNSSLSQTQSGSVGRLPIPFNYDH